jgi:hypothetical protein
MTGNSDGGNDMRRRLALVAGLTALAALGATAPALAATTGSTTVTFAVNAGALNITVPATANLGSGAPGGTITGQLGTVTVSDQRGLLVAAWTATVTSSDFKTGGGTAAETIPAGNVTYWSGPATANTGLGVVVPGQATAAAAVPLSTTAPVTAFSKALGAGNNTTSWNPTLTVSVPAAAVAGTYTGTVTHSVA